MCVDDRLLHIVAGVKRLLMKLKSREIYSGTRPQATVTTFFYLSNAWIRLQNVLGCHGGHRVRWSSHIKVHKVLAMSWWRGNIISMTQSTTLCGFMGRRKSPKGGGMQCKIVNCCKQKQQGRRRKLLWIYVTDVMLFADDASPALYKSEQTVVLLG